MNGYNFIFHQRLFFSHFKTLQKITTFLTSKKTHVICCYDNVICQNIITTYFLNITKKISMEI
ncbi:173R [Invertebrate iridescent virus Kaz2018]|nr:173R [Invertebrate iridescent virus Kaz2018]